MIHWTPERDKYIIDNRGILSAATMGNALGVTRNAVLGRVNRLGLPKIKHAVTGGNPRRPQVVQSGGKTKIRKPPEREYVSPPVPIEPLNIPFIDLGQNHCREIVGSDGIGMSLSCGHPVIHESSYCRWHHSINHTIAAPHPRFRAAA